MKQQTKKILTSLFLLTCITTTLSALTATRVTAASKPFVAFDQSELVLTAIGETFQLNLTISNVENLYQWITKVTWDPNILSLEGNPQEGEFLKQKGETMYIPVPIENNAIEVSSTSVTALATLSGVSGSGVLAIFTFKALKPAIESPISLVDTQLYAPGVDNSGSGPIQITIPIPHELRTPTIITLISGDAPIAEAGPDQTVNEETEVFFEGSKSVAASGNLTYAWTFVDNGTQTLDGETPTYLFTFPGIYVVTLTVSTLDGKTGSDNTTITVLDVTPPVPMISIGGELGNKQICAGQIIEFKGDQSFDPDNGTIESYLWDFGDGNTSDVLNPTYAFAQNGTHTVRLTVKDMRANLTQTGSLRLFVLSADEAIDPYALQIGSLSLPPTIVGVLLFVTAVVIVGSAFWLFGVSTKKGFKK